MTSALFNMLINDDSVEYFALRLRQGSKRSDEKPDELTCVVANRIETHFDRFIHSVTCVRVRSAKNANFIARKKKLLNENLLYQPI